MNHIIPTIFANSKKEFLERFHKLVPISKKIQIDFMDGLFVPVKSPSLPKSIDLKDYKNDFEAHLMYNRPITHIKKLKQKGFKKIIFHLESKSDIHNTILEIKKQKLKCWIAINPETLVEKTVPFLKEVDGILFMGVHPGREKQEFIPSVYKKIKTLKKLAPYTKTQIDGGATPTVIKKLAKLGIIYVNSGSYIYNSDKPNKTIKNLNSFFN